MKYDIPFGKDTLSIEIPQSQVIFYANMVKNDIPADTDALIRNSLDNPIGTDRLENMVKKGQKVMIISDDITRPTPKRLLINHIAGRLASAGIPDSDITICIAPGTHRPMTDSELMETYGHELLSRFSFININYQAKDHLVDFGRTPSGIPIEIYREARDSDFLIGIGNIVPHVSAGWGGGAKIIQPGICGEATTQATHMIAALNQNVMDTCGNADNTCRHEMEAIAAEVGLRFIVNTVMDEQEHVLGVFSGDFIKAHREGIRKAKLVQCPAIPAKADILIASANPCNLDFWQGDKPFVFAQYGLNDNGTLIFVMSAEEGLCGDAPQHDAVVRKYGMLGEKRLREDIEKGLVDDLIGIDAPIHLEQVRNRGVQTLLVTKGFTEEDAASQGFIIVPSLEEAFEMAKKRQGENASVGIIPYCGETLVEVRNW